MKETNLRKLYRGVIIGLIVAVVPLMLLGTVQLIYGIKVKKDNAEAIKLIQENYMRTDLFERWVVLLEERTARNTKLVEKAINEHGDLDDRINNLYNELKIKAYGKTRGETDTTNITYHGIY